MVNAMKILITTDLYTTETNGVVTSVRNLRDYLKEKGHDVRILTLSESMNSHKDGDVSYIRSVPIGVYPNIRMPVSYHHRLVQELIDWKPDVIHSQCEFFSFQYAARIARLTGAPIVHTYHTLYDQYVTYVVPSKRLGNRLVQIFLRKRLKDVDQVIAPTHKVEHSLLNYGVKNKISVVPSGISLEQHQKRLTEEERRAKRASLGISDDQKVLLYLGRLGTEKNLDELLGLFADAFAENPSLVLLIVGGGPAREQLERYTDKLHIHDHVIFTGMVEPSEVQEYYQLGDVFVSASTSETQGLTYIEAAANGLPLLCRQDLCLQDVIEQGENGFEYTTEEEFLQNIEAIMQNPDWRVHAGKRSEEIAAGFDKEIFGETMEKVYESLLK